MHIVLEHIRDGSKHWYGNILRYFLFRYNYWYTCTKYQYLFKHAAHWNDGTREHGKDADSVCDKETLSWDFLHFICVFYSLRVRLYETDTKVLWIKIEFMFFAFSAVSLDNCLAMLFIIPESPCCDTWTKYCDLYCIVKYSVIPTPSIHIQCTAACVNFWLLLITNIFRLPDEECVIAIKSSRTRWKENSEMIFSRPQVQESTVWLKFELSVAGAMNNLHLLLRTMWDSWKLQNTEVSGLWVVLVLLVLSF